ncbi:hypothetical protein [Salinimicrobium sediminilitoris]|uniref:hypothetical protein n=1 Tax=Salinimicrobium sediminilitoris TaxID=2876715 RepID=UPI001E618B2B|nr:hypothetical protein [Salinimicrobium sediminilitoris]MCC8359472.1 hypothetical protein [Salinimicrobium sediminilitoris]
MRNFVFVLISVFLFGCSGDSLKTGKIADTYSVSNTETLEIFLTEAIPIEGGYNISQQAEHFTVSEIQYRDKGIYYVYVPEADFTGEDVVKITRADSNGATVYAKTVTTYNIDVTE